MKEIMEIVLEMKADIKALKAEVTKLKKAGKPPAKQLVKPSWEDAAQYFHELGSNTCQDDAHAFIDHFTSNGWKVGGKTPMKCWKSAVRNFKRGNNKGNRNEKAKSNGITSGPTITALDNNF